MRTQPSRRRPAAPLLCCGAALLAAAPAAAQQPVSGLYMGAGVGANWVMDTGLSVENRVTTALRNLGVSPAGGDATFQAGVVALGSVGWGFGNGWRVEGEANYRYNDVDSISGFGVAGRGFVGLPPTGTIQGSGGRQQTLGLMANVFYDFQIASAPWVVPYLGAGVGVAWTNLQDTRVNIFPVAPGGPFARMNIGNTQVNFAYQAIAGVAFPIPTVPGLAITAEYRFMRTLANDFGATFVSQRTGQTIASGAVRAENQNNSVLVGVRYAFNAPRPAPAPAPAAAPAPARTFLVFFDWDRADLTDRARQIIAEAANNARTVGSTRIEVQGHADRTGSAAYNQRLSVRRAEAVAAELVRRGINRGEITVQGFGFDRPLVPTAMGVREPQNRRVEIILR